MKLLSIIRLLVTAGAVVLLTGCTHTILAYSPSAKNLNTLKSLSVSSHSISLRDFSDPKKINSISCRLEGDEDLPNNMTYVSYIHNALRQELKLSGLYSNHASTKLDAVLQKVDSDSIMGEAHWTISMKFNDHHQAPYVVTSQYAFSANYVADIACSEVAQAFPPAVQKFLHTLYSNKHFQETLRGQ